MRSVSPRKLAPLSLPALIVVWLLGVVVPGATPLAAQNVWTPATQTGTTANLFDVAFGNGLFVAVGNAGTIVTSPDGDIWTARTSGINPGFASIAFGNGAFVAVTLEFAGGQYVSTAVRSTNGIDWTPVDIGVAAVNRIVFGNGKFVATAFSSPNPSVVLTSTDGSTWTPHNWPAQTPIYKIASGDGRFVAFESALFEPGVLQSTDGATWTRSAFNASNCVIDAVTFANGKFIAFGDGITFGGSTRDGFIFTSTDGVTWTDPPLPLDGHLQAVATGNGFIAGAGPDGDTFSSADAQLWTRRAPAANQPYAGAAFGNNRFVLVGATGKIATHDASFSPTAVVSWKTEAITVDEIEGAAVLTIQRTGNLSGQLSIELKPTSTLTYPPVTMLAGEAEATLSIPLFYDAGRSTNALGREEIVRTLRSGFDYAFVDPKLASAIILDHEAPIRFTDLKDLDATDRGDGSGDFEGELMIQNAGTATTGPLRIRLNAVPFGFGGTFPGGFNYDSRTLGFTDAAGPLAPGAEIWLPFSSVTPKYLTFPLSNGNQGVVYWEIYASLEEQSGGDWLLVDRWLLFDWGKPSNAVRNGVTSGVRSGISFGKTGPAGSGGATIVSAASGVFDQFVAITELSLVGPAVVTSGVNPKFSLVAKLSNNSLCNAPPEWSTTFGTISAAGKLTVPAVNDSTPVTITGAVTYNGVKRTVTKNIRIEPPRTPAITSAASVFATTGQPFTYRITALNKPTSFAATGLPDGLAVNPTLGLIVGVPTTPGTVQVTISATNAGGTDQRTLNLQVFDPSPLVVTQEGDGTLTEPFPGTVQRFIGSVYTITAKPAASSLFAGWSGGISSSNPKLTFTMVAGLTLKAKFIPNPFPACKGTYAGLVYAFPASHALGGFFTATTTATGGFTARLIYGGTPFTLVGRFGFTGDAAFLVRRPGKSTLLVEFHLDVEHGGESGIYGTLTDGVEKPAITANRMVPLPELFPVLHTARVSPPAAAGLPKGEGFGTILSGQDQRLRFAGKLPDGSAFSYAGPLVINSNWPFYAGLYRGRGSISGIMKIRDQTGISDLDGPLNWYKPAGTSRVHPAGWPAGIAASFRGSAYNPGLPTDASRFFTGLSATGIAGNVSVTLSAGNLAADIVAPANLFSTGKLIPLASPENVKSKLTPATGLFNGSFTVPGSKTRRTFFGAVFQKQNVGVGFFLGDDESGQVVLAPK